MARFHGEVGYGNQVETAPGVWQNVIEEQAYTGDVVRKTSRQDFGEGLNANIILGNTISIIADQYAIEHYSKIKYVKWEGARWTVTQVEVRRPRLILTLGEVYNGPTP